VADKSLTPLGSGAFLFTRDDGTRGRAWVIKDGRITWVFVDGRVHRLEPEPPARSSGPSSPTTDDTALASPMPATVSAVNVAVGDAVTKGDVLVTLEAMKMELPIRAPRDGIVRRIACAPGELVQPGIPLVALG
jgi:biotin carboxyl carrier protein